MNRCFAAKRVFNLRSLLTHLQCLKGEESARFLTGKLSDSHFFFNGLILRLFPYCLHYVFKALRDLIRLPTYAWVVIGMDEVAAAHPGRLQNAL